MGYWFARSTAVHPQDQCDPLSQPVAATADCSRSPRAKRATETDGRSREQGRPFSRRLALRPSSSEKSEKNPIFEIRDTRFELWNRKDFRGLLVLVLRAAEEPRKQRVPTPLRRAPSTDCSFPAPPARAKTVAVASRSLCRRASALPPRIKVVVVTPGARRMQRRRPRMASSELRDLGGRDRRGESSEILAHLKVGLERRTML